MKFFQRFISFLFSIGFAGIGTLFFILFSRAPFQFMSMTVDGNLKFVFLLATVFFFFFAFRSLILAFGKEKPEGFGSSSTSFHSVIQYHAELGQIGVSLEVLKKVGQAAAQKVRGVKVSTITILRKEIDTTVEMEITFDGITPIPQITEELQKGVKHELETITGLVIRDVNIHITDVTPSQPNRVK